MEASSQMRLLWLPRDVLSRIAEFTHVATLYRIKECSKAARLLIRDRRQDDNPRLYAYHEQLNTDLMYSRRISLWNPRVIIVLLDRLQSLRRFIGYYTPRPFSRTYDRDYLCPLIQELSIYRLYAILYKELGVLETSLIYQKHADAIDQLLMA
jgi:hypothetical protein